MFMREFQSNFFDLVVWCPLGHIGTSGGIRTHVTSALEVRYSSAELHPYIIEVRFNSPLAYNTIVYYKIDNVKHYFINFLVLFH